MIIGLDFDGTVVAHEFPEIGKDIGAVPYLKKFVADGHKLVLNTMRSGKHLDEAVKWFEDRDVELYGINEEPEQKEWTSSPKVYADIYIDDAALGAPLKYEKGVRKGYIDWEQVEALMLMRAKKL